MDIRLRCYCWASVPTYASVLECRIALFAQCDSNRQDRPEDSPGSKSQLSEKSPLEPLDDEVEEAPLTPLDREVPSKPAEPLPLEDLGIAQSEPSSESGMFLLINILYSIVLSFFCDLLKFRIPFQSNDATSLETK